MWFEFEDEDAYQCLGQYMLGESVLVVPVVSGDSRVRYWLPPGEWHHAFTTRTERGPQWIDELVPLDVMPLWLRGGRTTEMTRPALRTAAALAQERRIVQGPGWGV
jgi:alpha-glucosidase (family GH31 glycosyl hydrolase)